MRADVGHPTVSVLLSTHNRASTLKDTLLCLRQQEIGLDWELLVVDDGSTDETPYVLSSLKRLLPLVALHQPRGGKSRAINLALTYAKSQLLVFTDDDVRPVPNWLDVIERGFAEYADAGVCCGPIKPIFPNQTPEWLCDNIWAAPAFGHFAPPLPKGYLPPPLLPFGTNFAVRAQALGSLRMQETLGPSLGLMGEDTHLLRELRLTQRFIFLPGASVGHVIQPEQVTFPWLFERAFVFGRSMVCATGRATVHLPPIRRSSLWAACCPATHLDLGCRLNFLYGQLCQLCVAGQPTVALEAAISKLGWTGDPSLLACSALQWLRANTPKIPAAVIDEFEVKDS